MALRALYRPFPINRGGNAMIGNAVTIANQLGLGVFEQERCGKACDRRPASGTGNLRVQGVVRRYSKNPVCYEWLGSKQ